MPLGVHMVQRVTSVHLPMKIHTEAMSTLYRYLIVSTRKLLRLGMNRNGPELFAFSRLQFSVQVINFRFASTNYVHTRLRTDTKTCPRYDHSLSRFHFQDRHCIAPVLKSCRNQRFMREQEAYPIWFSRWHKSYPV